MRSQVNSNVVTAPVILRSAVIVSSPVAGILPPVSFDSTKIQNTLRVPIEVTEILFSVMDRYPQAAHAGSGIEFDLAVGRNKMTDDFVPFAAIAPWGDEDVYYGYAIEDVAFGPEEERMVRRVILPQPIRLQPGVGFSGRVRRRPGASALAIAAPNAQVVTMTLIGRVAPTVPLRPQTQRVPFWSSSRLAFPAAGVAPYKQTTVESELRNPLASSLDVTHLIAAALGDDAAGGGGPTFIIADDYQNQPAPQIQIRWPNGDLLNPLVAGYGGVGAKGTFMRRHALRQPFTMPPNSRAVAAASIDPIPAAGFDFEWVMALFGTRLEVF